MLVTLQQEHTMPRSALRHRPIGTGGDPVITKKLPHMPTRASRPRTQTQTIKAAPAAAIPETRSQAKTTSTVPSTRPEQSTPNAASSTQAKGSTAAPETAPPTPPAKPAPRTTQTTSVAPVRQRVQTNTRQHPATSHPIVSLLHGEQRTHGLVLIGIGMSIAIVLVMLCTFLFQWGENVWNDLQYGTPRTFQTDAFVGHEAGKTPSHFVALNLHGRVEIIELPGGDASHAHIYVGPQLAGPGADNIPVTLQFASDGHPKSPDMVVSFQHTQIIFHNQHGTFHPG